MILIEFICSQKPANWSDSPRINSQDWTIALKVVEKYYPGIFEVLCDSEPINVFIHSKNKRMANEH